MFLLRLIWAVVRVLWQTFRVILPGLVVSE
jgi:hypothetical protein